MTEELSSDHPPVESVLLRWVGGALILVVCIVLGPYLYLGAVIGFVKTTSRPGVGDVQQAQARIATGMTKDEVRAQLGSPHQVGIGIDKREEWDYWETAFVSSVLRI